jgi:adenine C2-methylase RlmN of 23S rRNA A2503 and tRNA A37
MVPLARAYSVSELAGRDAATCRSSRRSRALGLGLMSGVNTGEDEAEAIALQFAGGPVRVHLIDVNDPSGTLPALPATRSGADSSML